MRVLIATSTLDRGGGTQTYSIDLAAWLLDRGHSPVIYSPRLGDGAALAIRRAVPVTDDLSMISVVPDVIHGNSTVETVVAMLHFPEAPAVFVCHGWRGPLDAPPKFDRVRRYVAVDDTCADRLLLREGIAAEKVSVLLNGVDLSRFPQRGPLPPRPQRALVFGNWAHELTHLAIVRQACKKAGIEVDVVGDLSGNYSAEPETLLGRYDLVFAKGKAAMEAIVSGAAIIVCDDVGIGGMVRSHDLQRMRRLNFGFRTLTTPLSVDALSREIAAYDAKDARAVSDSLREVASTDALHESLLSLYETVITEPRTADWREEARAAARFIERMARGPRHGHEQIHVALRATQRVLSIPLVGRGIAKAARWLAKSGRK